MKWMPIESAPEGVEVMTKIHDCGGERNKQPLIKKGRLWFFPDMSMYVYYMPTHWMPLPEPPKSILLSDTDKPVEAVEVSDERG